MNKATKQEINERAESLVRSEVYTNASWMIQELSSNEKYMDEIMEFSSCYTDHHAEIEELKDKKEGVEEKRDYQIDDLNDHIDSLDIEDAMDQWEDVYDAYISAIEETANTDSDHIDQCIFDLEGEQEYPNEALEFWIVSDWLIGKLEDMGELTTREFMGFAIWGRQTSGQSIYMDYTFQSLAESLLTI